MSDLASRLNELREMLDDGDISEAAYQRRLAKLRAQHGDAAVDAALRQDITEPPPPAASQTVTDSENVAQASDHAQAAVIGGSAQVGTFIQSAIGGNVFIAGQRGKDAATLLRGYLERQLKRCGSLPLQGVRQQKSSEDVLAISLEQVYTQLATTTLVERDVLEGEALHAFDAAAYLDAHVGEYLLPVQQRIEYRAPASEAREGFGMGRTERSLAMLDGDDLATLAQQSAWLHFLGPQLVTEAIATYQHLVLLGEPGSGKSTALRYLALTLAQAGLDGQVALADRLDGWDTLGDAGRLLPLFLPLLPFARSVASCADHPCNADDLWNHIATELEASGRYEGLAAVIHDELEQGRVLLLLDGLDEVAGVQSRRQVVRAVQAFATHYPQCRIVVSCRIRAYEGEHNREWQLAGWPTATLAAWTVGQMQHFVQAWYAAAAAASKLPDERRDERTTALQAAIDRRDDLKRLGIRPLLLTIMALVHLNDGRLPEERVGLYSRCIDLLLGQWELAKDDGTDYQTLMDYIGLPDSDVKTLRPLLQQAAFTAHEASSAENPGSLGRDTLRVMVMDALAQKGHPKPYEGAEQFLIYTDLRAGLIQASAAGESYVFPHLTFQEYLAGLELVRGVEFVQRILDRRTDDRWRVPILLGLGHLVSESTLSGPYQVLSKLVHSPKLERSEEQRQRDLLFVAELAEDVGWDRLEQGDDLFERLRADLAQALVSVVEGTTLPAQERVQAGVFLATLGDPRPGVCTLPPAMVRIEGGEFVIGILPDEEEETVQAFKRDYPDVDDDALRTFVRSWINDQSIAIATFELGRYPVTNAQYKRFIDDGGYDPHASWWDEAWRTWLLRDDNATEGLERWQQRDHKQHPEWWHHPQWGIARPNHPVVGVSWYEAVAFCRWLTQHQEYNPEGYTYRLPSEAEWEYAARRNTRRIYPWGDDPPDAERANYGTWYHTTTAVGCFRPGATPEGLDDLAGNVWDWTRSAYRAYPYDADDGREDTSNPAEKRFTLRGGGWGNGSFDMRASFRLNSSPDLHDDLVGFRLARHLAV